MPASIKDVECAARIFWKGAATHDSSRWADIAQCMHGIDMVASGRAYDTAVFLRDLAHQHANIAREAEIAQKTTPPFLRVA